MAPRLPLGAAELAARASHAIAADPDRTSLRVTGIRLLDVADAADEVDVSCAVSVVRPGRPDERWHVILRFGTDLDPETGASPDAMVAVVRALLDEWWHTKDADASVAAWGTRRA